jgi:TolB-like protein/Flp pilus assembly protein TadD
MVAGLAWTFCYAGQPREAIPLLQQAMRLSPVYPAWFVATLGLAYMMIGDYPNAIAAHEHLIERKSLLQFAYTRLAAIHAMLGNNEKARAFAADLLKIKPDFTISGWSRVLIYKNEENLDWELNALRKAGLPENTPLKLPDKPSIAVLPFDAYSDEPEQKHFANGLAEDLTTALSKIPDIFVIASTSTQKYKDKEVDAREVAKEQGVRYVLEGSIQKSGDNVRMNVQLVDGASGQHVWAEKYDRPATDFFAIQDDIVRRVLVEMQVELTEGEHARLAAGGTNSLKAWLLRIQAYNESIKLTRESQIRARELYQAAHEADPNWAMPVAGPSFTHWYEARRGWGDSREESIRLGIELAERAIALQPDEWIGYMALCNMMFMIEETERGIDACRKSIKLAPNSFAAVGVFAIRLSEADREHEAIELFERAVRLSPQYPWWIDFGYGFALHLVGRKEEAIEIYKKGIDKGAQSAPLRVRLAAVYVDLGQMDEAKAAIDDALKINPQFTATKYRKSYPYPGDERYDWYHDLIIRAGLPR